jgi:hypothetical protein
VNARGVRPRCPHVRCRKSDGGSTPAAVRSSPGLSGARSGCVAADDNSNPMRRATTSSTDGDLSFPPNLGPNIVQTTVSQSVRRPRMLGQVPLSGKSHRMQAGELFPAHRGRTAHSRGPFESGRYVSQILPRERLSGRDRFSFTPCFTFSSQSIQHRSPPVVIHANFIWYTFNQEKCIPMTQALAVRIEARPIQSRKMGSFLRIAEMGSDDENSGGCSRPFGAAGDRPYGT